MITKIFSIFLLGFFGLAGSQIVLAETISPEVLLAQAQTEGESEQEKENNVEEEEEEPDCD